MSHETGRMFVLGNYVNKIYWGNREKSLASVSFWLIDLPTTQIALVVYLII